MFELMLIVFGLGLRESADAKNVALGNIFVGMGVGAAILTSRHAVVVVQGTDDVGLVSKDMIGLPPGTKVRHVTPLR